MPKNPTPAQEAAQQAQEPTQAVAAPAADPGPPPVRPAQPIASYVSEVANKLYEAAGRYLTHGYDHVRDELRAINIIHEPPAVHHYRAELLSWLDALEAHAKKLVGRG